MSQTVYESRIASLPLIARGKVRDIYAVGEQQMLIVNTDRLSEMISERFAQIREIRG